MDCLRFRAVVLMLFGICILNLNVGEQMKASSSLLGEYHYPETALSVQSGKVQFIGVNVSPFSH